MINEDELGYAVLHVEPRCAEFEAMDPLTYVTEARKLKEKQLKERMPKA